MTAAEGVRQALEDIVWRCSAGIPRPLLPCKRLGKEVCRALAAELQRDLDSRQEEALSRAPTQLAQDRRRSRRSR